MAATAGTRATVAGSTSQPAGGRRKVTCSATGSRPSRSRAGDGQLVTRALRVGQEHAAHPLGEAGGDRLRLHAERVEPEHGAAAGVAAVGVLVAPAGLAEAQPAVGAAVPCLLPEAGIVPRVQVDAARAGRCRTRGSTRRTPRRRSTAASRRMCSSGRLTDIASGENMSRGSWSVTAPSTARSARSASAVALTRASARSSRPARAADRRSARSRGRSARRCRSGSCPRRTGWRSASPSRRGCRGSPSGSRTASRGR